MAILLPLRGVAPKVASSVFVAENATLTGDIEIGENSSIWYQVVIRGDVNKIRIGKNVNIQDHSMVHGSVGRKDTIIEDNVSIGHRAIVHGCHIKSNVLVGMGAIILDDVVIEENVIIGAGAVVTQGKHLESGFIYAGIPAKKIKALDADGIHPYIAMTSASYVENAKLYKKEQG